MNRHDAVNFLLTKPYKLGRMVGFTKLTELHNSWIIEMIKTKEDTTLQGHRGSYKTTCLSIALAIIMILLPNKHILFMRKTDTDTKEIVAQVKKILESPQMKYFVFCIYGAELKIVTANATAITTNLCQDARGTPQLYAMGIGGSLTGKHFDFIFTDDIVNVEDRISRAAREQTKLIYQELQNIKNRGGRIFNTGTPWHADDCFVLMPNIKKYDCYHTGLIEPDELEKIRNSMTSSLFAANYELKHVSDEEVIFTTPKTGADPAMVKNGISQIDAAYGGEDYTAFTICQKRPKYETQEDGSEKLVGYTYYLFGKLWKKHIDDVENEIITYHQNFLCGKLYCETNADKGYLAKDLRKKGVPHVVNYHEDTNKYFKITSYLKAVWKDVIFVAGTDENYINQICDYNENADHDDAPDSAASIIRTLWKKGETEYQPVFM